MSLAAFPVRMPPFLSVLRTGASRAKWPPLWMRGPGAGCRCGRRVRRCHGDLEPARADGRPHPQRHLLMSSVQHWHFGFLGAGRQRGRLPVGLRQARIDDAECADRREEATGHQDASGRAGRCSKHGILTSGRVSYMHAFVSASCLRCLEAVSNHPGASTPLPVRSSHRISCSFTLPGASRPSTERSAEAASAAARPSQIFRTPTARVRDANARSSAATIGAGNGRGVGRASVLHAVAVAPTPTNTKAASRPLALPSRSSAR